MAELRFDDFTVGREFRTASRVVSDADIAAFAALSGDNNRLHTDDAYARTTAFGGRVAHGALGVALATGLISQSGITSAILIALTGLTWTFKAPIRPHDEVHVRLRVSNRRVLSDDERGVITFAVEVVNQRGEIVQTGEITELVKTRH